jgi:hypothetical protein
MQAKNAIAGVAVDGQDFGMNVRSLLPMCFGALLLSSANGGLILQHDRAQRAAASIEATDKGPEKPVTATKDALGQEKKTLNRLVTELQRSARSFLYLRSVGFTETDQEFAEIIAKNNSMFRSVRIIRRDDQGNRQIPGWPGIALTADYKKLHR